MEELKRLYQDYIRFAQDLHDSINPVQSLFGVRDSEVQHPGHMEFYNAVKRWTASFLENPHESSEVAQALEIILFSAAGHDKDAAVWYLIAAQDNARPLLELLPPETKQAIRKKYQKCYPKGRRLPLQNDLYAQMGK